MAQKSVEIEEFASHKWQRDRPSQLWSFWLAGAKPDGPGLRRWQTWIWWTKRQGYLAKIGAFILLTRGLIEAPYEAWAGLRRFGEKTKRVHSIARMTQYRQILMLRWRYGMRPEQYYRFQLFKPERKPIAQHFISEIGQLLQVIHRHSPRTQDERIFLCKEEFRQWCAANDIPTVTNLLEAKQGKVISRIADCLPAADLFVKPTNWLQGKGVSRWWCKQESSGHYYTGNSGMVLNPAELEDFVCRTSVERDRPYIVQAALTNHHDLRNLTNGALATVRLMTVRGSEQSAQPLMAALRMPTGGAIVDNFDGGGIAAPINLVNGVCGSGIQKKVALPPDVLLTHPDTGFEISGFMLPFWDECLALTCRAHDMIQAHVPVIGWDVAILDKGPILVEANYLPCDNLAQMPGGFPLGNSPFAEIVLARLRGSFIADHFRVS